MTSSIKRLRNRSPQRARSTRQEGQWSPSYLAPYAWYDAHIGGSSTQITDSSGNARAAMTVGGGSNSPAWLPYTVPSLHLEAATAGTNSLSCVAPAGTASYSAAPRGGGAPTTGAASAGAFTFTTAGDWASVSLLNAGAAEIAKFSAASSTQSGHSDTYGVAWTINRGTAGRKSVIQSPVANSARSMFLLGPDDHLDGPAAALPAMVGQAWSHIVVVRQHPTAAGGRWSSTKFASGFASVLHATAPTTAQHYVNGGGPGVAFATGQILVIGGVGDGSNGNTLLINAGSASLAATNVQATTWRIGADPSGGANQDFEFLASLWIAGTVTASNWALLTSHYLGGL